ncbi:YjfB family protein [Helicovermis profundi]|uniref:Motility protein n=1 Tax=Helicovermis profundi TaxID=3065157 RepID=A0AAU9E3D1_9FIRM|nr:hypothetical protein HLPR_14100 [Clostridia bacterium S502]
MDIASLSTAMSQMNIASQVSTRVMKLGMDSAKQNMENQLKIIEQSVSPNLGKNIDIKL